MTAETKLEWVEEAWSKALEKTQKNSLRIGSGFQIGKRRVGKECPV